MSYMMLHAYIITPQHLLLGEFDHPHLVQCRFYFKLLVALFDDVTLPMYLELKEHPSVIVVYCVV